MTDTTTLQPLADHPPGPVSPGEMLTEAIRRGIDADGIVKLAETFERMETARAKREFTAALLNFQRDCPPIVRDTIGVHEAKFTPLWKIRKLINPILWQYGFTVDWTMDVEQGDEKKAPEVVTVVTLAHVGGYEKQGKYSTPIDPAPRMSQTHATASADSFAIRRALQGVLGIETTFDDDGKEAAYGAKLPPEQLEQLRALVDETGVGDDQAFRNFCKVDSLADLPAEAFGRVYQALTTRKRRMEEAKRGGQP